jgi:hypothetical protein
MSGYSYNNISIANLIQSGNTSVPGFNISSTPFQFSSGFDKPANFSYSYQGTDISNYTTANMYVSTSNANSGNIPLQIGNSNSYFNHVSVCGAGGGGGGGGGGNYMIDLYDGGKGGSGGSGSYGAIVAFPVSGSTSLSYNVGGGGAGENAKGSQGGNTSVSVGNTTIISCPGGNGGEPGNGAKTSGNGSPGDSGNANNSSVTPGYSSIENANSNYYPEFPPQQGNGYTNGNGGGGGNSTTQNFNTGSKGNAGFVLVYFSL